MGLLSKLKGLAGGEIAKPLDALTGTLKVVDSMSTSEEEKAGLRKLVTLAVIDAQSTVLKAEVANGTWLARSWRPLLMLAFGVVIVWKYVVTADPIPEQMWTFLMVGVGGYIGGRTVEKVATTVAPTYTARQLRKLAKAGIEGGQDE